MQLSVEKCIQFKRRVDWTKPRRVVSVSAVMQSDGSNRILIILSWKRAIENKSELLLVDMNCVGMPPPPKKIYNVKCTNVEGNIDAAFKKCMKCSNVMPLSLAGFGTDWTFVTPCKRSNLPSAVQSPGPYVTFAPYSQCSLAILFLLALSRLTSEQLIFYCHFLPAPRQSCWKQIPLCFSSPSSCIDYAAFAYVLIESDGDLVHKVTQT